MTVAIKIKLVLLSFMLAVTTACGQSETDYDLVIINGRVMDPETGFDQVSNVGVRGGEIAVITTESIDGDEAINAEGLIVAPGFIDLHAHGQNIGDYRMQAMQGVTTMLELESGVLPVSDWYDDQAEKKLPINYGTASAWTYARIATFTETEPEATIKPSASIASSPSIDFVVMTAISPPLTPTLLT